MAWEREWNEMQARYIIKAAQQLHPSQGKASTTYRHWNSQYGLRTLLNTNILPCSSIYRYTAYPKFRKLGGRDVYKMKITVSLPKA
jgi:hypothetical protein